MSKIVFILNSIQQQRCIKRIEEFISKGYEIEAYGFNRSETVPTKPVGFDIEIIGDIKTDMPTFQRIKVMHKAIKEVRNKHKGQDVIYYYFLLDVALASGMLRRNRFCYENSDLMYGYFPKKLQQLFKKIDVFVTKRSLVTVFTSAGFVEYLFGKNCPDNVVVIPNRLNKRILQLPYTEKSLDINHLTFTYVGALRQPATRIFVETLLKYFPQHEFHFHGMIHEKHKSFYSNLASKYSQFHLGGTFSNPKDLPGIYEKCDILVSAMGLESSPNIEYAEPNKFYEAIYFRKPIVVSANSYVGRKVKEMGIGYCVSDFTEEGIRAFISSITEESLEEIHRNLEKIPQEEAVDDNPQLYKLLQIKLAKQK